MRFRKFLKVKSVKANLSYIFNQLYFDFEDGNTFLEKRQLTASLLHLNDNIFSFSIVGCVDFRLFFFNDEYDN